MIRIEVSAGIVRDERGRVLICRRKGELDGLWEFPGGKREAGESFEGCLKRELREELQIEVEISGVLGEVVHLDGEREIRLVFLNARACGDAEIKLCVHGKAAWVLPCEFGKYAFCPADQELLDMGVL